jgi:sucrose phosphorylase
MFDAVFNHMSAQSAWFQGFLQDEPEFRDFFVTVKGDPDLSQVIRPRTLPLLSEVQTAAGPRRVWTTFSADQVDLNFKNPRVLLAVLDALLFYVRQGARFIRLDAIAFLWKEVGTPCLHLPQTHQVIQLLRAVLDEVAPHVLLITETNVPHADNISYFRDGTDEAQLVYNFARWKAERLLFAQPERGPRDADRCRGPAAEPGSLRNPLDGKPRTNPYTPSPNRFASRAASLRRATA